VAVALIAVLVLAWVGLLLRDHRLGEEAKVGAFSRPDLPQAERDRRAEGLKDAQLLNPDSSLELARGSYLLSTGRAEDAVAVAESLLRDEPENIGAWGLLSQAAGTLDPARAAQAEAEIRRLDPLGSRVILPAAPPAG